MTKIKQKTALIKVNGVKIAFSISLLENKLPTVFRLKSISIIQTPILISFGEIFKFIILALSKIIIKNKAFILIDISSKIYISD